MTKPDPSISITDKPVPIIVHSERAKARSWKEWWVKHGVPGEVLDVDSDFYIMLEAAVEYLTGGHCKQCGAPLRLGGKE
jgi:hypothetical protein